MHKKSFNKPDEIRNPSVNTKVEVIKIADVELHHATFQPGWKWSVDVKPSAGTEYCQVHHLLYGISGRLNTVMADGTEIEMGPNDVLDIPPGHDGSVVGNEPFVCIDLGGAIRS